MQICNVFSVVAPVAPFVCTYAMGCAVFFFFYLVEWEGSFSFYQETSRKELKKILIFFIDL